MTEISESSINSLKIIYTRSGIKKTTYSAPALMFLSVAAFMFSGYLNPEPGAEPSGFAPIGLVLLEILMSACGLFFLAAIFDATEYFSTELRINFIWRAKEFFQKMGNRRRDQRHHRNFARN